MYDKGPRLKATIFTDGGTRKSNPGKGAYGYVIYARGKEGGKPIECGHGLIGISSNNVAEYLAAFHGLSAATALGFTDVILKTDSQMMANQISLLHECRNQRLKILLHKVQKITNNFEKFKIVWVPREKNRVADGLARKAMKEKWG